MPENVLKITAFSLEHLSLPDEDPNWKFAGQAYPTNDAVVLTLTAEDGTQGWGYAAAFPHLAATALGVEGALQRICPALVGQDAMAIEANLVRVQAALVGNNPAKAAIDCALHDLKARLLGVPLYELLGGKTTDRIAICRMLGLKTPPEMAERAQRLVDQGYRHLKLKVGGSVREDIERLRAVRRQVGDDVRLVADPNQSYRAKDAIVFAQRAVEFDVDIIEQPVPADDLDGLQEVTRASSIAIEADESAYDASSTYRLAASRSINAVSLKVPKMGGLRAVQTAARVCEVAHLGCRMGANVGSQLLAAHALHLAVALPNITYACELAEFQKLLNDPFEGLKVVDGHLHVPEGPGVGVVRRAS
ncbi:muconate cycloisomerase [Pigmentiphaga kullae]|uniref:Muconate cycloisomerase n=1 Tax=Pigmentiphaga kullae TaxID=151784 RepID=A0A4Q7N6H4_9BURK|nr:muconate cycloisomerase [Pigmentiphaga kullae]